MKTEIDILQYLPLPFQKIEEYIQISTTLNKEISELWNNHNNMYKAQFINTQMGIQTIERWEKICGISPYPSESVLTRVKNIRIAINKKSPYTKNFLHIYLDEFIGTDSYKLNINIHKRILTFEIDSEIEEVQSKNTVIQNMILEIIPISGIAIFKMWENTNKDLEAKTLGFLGNYSLRELECSRHPVQDIEEEIQ